MVEAGMTHVIEAENGHKQLPFCQPSRPILPEPTWPPVKGPGALKEHGAADCTGTLLPLGMRS